MLEPQEGWNGFNYLHHNASLVGSLDISFVSEKTNYQEIISKFNNGKIKLLYLLGADGSELTEKLKKTKKNSDSLIIYQGTHGGVGANIADIIIPSVAYSEKSEIYLNVEGRIQETTAAVPKLDGSYDAHDIFLHIAKKLNVDLGFKNKAGLRSRLIEEVEVFKNKEEIKKNSWIESEDIDLKDDVKIEVKDFNFYQTNIISKSSKIMNNFS